MAAPRGFGQEIIEYLRTVLGDEEAVADAFRAFAETLWLRIQEIRDVASPRLWAYRLAWLEAEKRPVHRRSRGVPSGAPPWVTAAVASGDTVHIGLLLRRESGLAELRASLGRANATLLFLRIQKGFAWDEIAGVLLEEGGRPEVAALKKRFALLKDDLARRARELGLLRSATASGTPRSRSASRRSRSQGKVGR